MAANSKAPLVLFGLVGVGALVALAAAGGGNPVQGATRVGGLVKGQIGRFFSWAELTVSTAAARLGLDNTPTPEAAQAMQLLVANVLDPLRAGLVDGPQEPRPNGATRTRRPAVQSACDAQRYNPPRPTTGDHRAGRPLVTGRRQLSQPRRRPSPSPWRRRPPWPP